MAIKIIGTGVTGNLVNDANYNFGKEDDFVFVESGSHEVNLTSATDPFGLSIVTGAGRDTIDTTIAVANSSQWIFAGSGDDLVLGGESRDTVFDGSGNDLAVLGGGADHVSVGLGNDRFDGGAGTEDWLSFAFRSFDAVSGATITENAAGVVVNLASTAAQNFGVFGLDAVTNFENISGGEGNDVFYGTSLNNRLYGSGGDDLLFGFGGNDDLRGDEGRDTIIGGAGADFMSVSDVYASAALRDRIVYRSITDSGLTDTTRDKIGYFDRGGLATDDKIDLSAIDASAVLAGNQAFLFLGTSGAFTSGTGGEVRLQVVGSDTLVHVDNDADVAAEMTFVVQGVTGLTAIDFIL